MLEGKVVSLPEQAVTVALDFMQCLGRLDRGGDRFGNDELVKEFRREVTAYLERKNENPRPINWQFTNEKARIELKLIYPTI